ncbi:type II toxin-antitoxin system VapC family toxin [Glaciihabitans sp. UYNi722]|uniref:type II toxin-antitoxin system VapC family toxin n=1 Tax=Glaciihabitans sp. UYNi722 TaxID=3156344 RepID=UPI0033973899
MIYLDSCIVIYAVEGNDERGDRVRQRLVQAGSSVVAISPLVMLECLVGALKSDNLNLRDHYTRAFEQFQTLEQDVEVFLRAAELRARHGLRTPDALHLATTQLTLCDELWTNDNRLAAVSGGIAVDVLHS